MEDLTPAPEEAPVMEEHVEELGSTPAESPVESGPSLSARAIEDAQTAADAADKAFREEVVEYTHHIRASILHEHSQYVDIPGDAKAGPRQEQFIGR